jgi:hypothetical protein
LVYPLQKGGQKIFLMEENRLLQGKMAEELLRISAQETGRPHGHKET